MFDLLSSFLTRAKSIFYDNSDSGLAAEDVKSALDEIVTSVSYVTAPATPTSTGLQGQQAYSANYYYNCVATDTWVRGSVETSW